MLAFYSDHFVLPLSDGHKFPMAKYAKRRECRNAGLPVAITMSGGYATDVDAIVTIHANTIRTAARLERGVAENTWHNTSVS